MPRRTVPLVAGHYYHVYNRGNNRAAIFFEPENYAFFLRRLREYVVTSDARVIAYALMPNHYHLLIQAQTDNLSHAMQLFGISYTKAINKQFNRVGAVFQGSFRAKEVDRDEYLLHLSRYIHLNPVRARLAQRPEEWPFSSYADYVGLRNGTLPQWQVVLQQFSRMPSLQTSEVSKTSEVWLCHARTRYQAFVEAYMSSDRNIIAHVLFDS
jgi:REP element-mobilizing transposase RayT